MILYKKFWNWMVGYKNDELNLYIFVEKLK